MLQQYIDYFKQITENHESIKSFHLGSMDELFSNTLNFDPVCPILYLEVYSIEGAEWNRDHSANTYLGAFTVYDRVAKHERSEMRMLESLSFSEGIAKSIIATMKDDRDSYHPLMYGLKGNFEMNKTRFMFDSLVGWRVEFEFAIT